MSETFWLPFLSGDRVACKPMARPWTKGTVEKIEMSRGLTPDKVVVIGDDGQTFKFGLPSLFVRHLDVIERLAELGT